jgi:hypothetical protein
MDRPFDLIEVKDSRLFPFQELLQRCLAYLNVASEPALLSPLEDYLDLP